MDVTDATFAAEVLERSQAEPVVVDFWADWCGPCKMLAPALEEATTAKGVTLAKVDVDANVQVAQEYGISGIPAVKAFRNGHVVAEFVGVQSKPAIEAFLEELTKPPVAESVDDPELKSALDAHDYERAFELLLARVGDAPEETRQTMVALFNELGHENPVVVRYRRLLASAIY